MSDRTTKAQVRSDWTYLRRLMRLAEEAMRADDLEELGVLALEMSGAVGTTIQYVEDRGLRL